ncbi:hypothetical protein E4U23_006577 [Claviceps purpurea]|nr:hypothetical protein E4U26_006515 [Claviceps purpurea]KAG6243343.1 hypothetical protein E4U23_006577 [Claviceps purpurea]
MSYQGGTTASQVDQRTPLEIKGDDILLIIAEEEAQMQLWVKGRHAVVVPAASPPAVSTVEFRYVTPEVRRCQIGRGVSQGTLNLPICFSKNYSDWCLEDDQIYQGCLIKSSRPPWTQEEKMAYVNVSNEEDNSDGAELAREMATNCYETGQLAALVLCIRKAAEVETAIAEAQEAARLQIGHTLGTEDKCSD